MGSWPAFRAYSRFAARLPSFVRRPVSLPAAREFVRQGLAQRPERFLRLVERGIFGHPGSPYRALLRHAGCELADLQRALHDHGLEGTLGRLREAGVHVAFEEFKGRRPIVRSGLEIPVRSNDFDNPHLGPAYAASSSGSTGAGTRVWLDLDHLAANARHVLLARAAWGLGGAPWALWRGVLPTAAGINNVLRGVHVGEPPERWFSPVATGDFGSLRSRFSTHALVAMIRLLGGRAPFPETVRLDEGAIVARWASAASRRHGSCVVNTSVSQAVRVATAARAAGIDLAGTTFMIGGETPTRAKVGEIRRAGARHVTGYYCVETGAVGLGCAAPVDENDNHLLSDALAVIQHPRVVADPPMTVPAFLFTSLLPTAPKILLNVEVDDYGVLERRRCGCPLGDLGYDLHLREIKSFGKLTGEGVTLIGSDMLQILEEVLPARFGGGPLDYQLAEEEEPSGVTRLSLFVSPRLPPLDEAAVVEVVLAALRGRPDGGDFASAMWRQAGTLRVVRREPIWGRGKLMPLLRTQRGGL
jgi:hypothetical protein